MTSIRRPADLTAWMQARWPWLALNLFAVGLLVNVWGEGTLGYSPKPTFHPGLESGKWALRWLLISLSMTPLNAYLGWRGASHLRKPAGLWAFAFAAAHFLSFLADRSVGSWLKWDLPAYLFLGLSGMLILAALAFTSNKEAMRLLGKNWKRLHRWVYLAGAAIILHAILAMDASKLLGARDPDALPELQVYLLVYVLLMLLRLPAMRKLPKRLLMCARRLAQ